VVGKLTGTWPGILPANDDDSTDLVGLGFTVNYFGLSFTDLYVNNNGNVTFDDPLSASRRARAT